MTRVAIRNPNRTVLIDDSYENLTLHAKGSQFIKTPGLGETYVPYFTFSVPMIGGVPPAIAIRCESGDMGMHILRSVISGNSLVVTVLWEPVIPNGDNGTLYWYAFYPANKTSLGKGALVLRNRSTGVITFDSDFNYLRVVDVVSGVSEASKSYPSGRRYAAIAMRVQYVVVTDNVYLEHVDAWRWYADWEFMTSRWVNQNLNIRKVQMHQTEEGIPNGGGGTWSQSGYSFLIVDVTGY
ncbi:MAG: hypothetical protein AB7U71_02805 [Comamonas sp.]